jgi:hypothetical protein
LKFGSEACGRPQRRWEDNIAMDLRKIVWEVVDWIYNYLAQNREWCLNLVNTVMNLRFL